MTSDDESSAELGRPNLGSALRYEAHDRPGSAMCARRSELRVARKW